MTRKVLPGIAAVLLCVVTSAASAAAPTAASTADRASRAARQRQLIAVIEGDAPWLAKDQACRELKVIGSRASIPALAGLLGDEKLSHMARYALESMPYGEVDQAFIDALGRTSGEAKVGIINSLGFRRCAAAGPVLVKLLKARDTGVAVAATAALGRIATPPAVEALAKLRASGPAGMKAVVAEASLTAAQRLRQLGRADEAAAIYEDLRGAGWPRRIRMAAFVGLLRSRPDQAARRIIGALGGDDALLRAVAVAEVASLKGAAVGRRFAAELPKLPPPVQVLLIGALADRDDPAVRSAVLAMVESPSANVRLAAAKALGKIGDATCVAALCKMLASPASPQEKAAAAVGLRSMTAAGVDKALLAEMKNARPALRVELIAVLADRGAAGSVPELIEQARSDDPSVRAAAFKALGRLAGPGDLPEMLAALVAASAAGRTAEAELAVLRTARKVPETTAQADAVLAALKAAKGPAARSALLRVLGNIGGPKAYQAVVAALDDTSPEVRDAALRALADWPDARALPALLDLFGKTDETTHRVLVLRGCVRLLGAAHVKPAEVVKTYSRLLAAARRAEDKKLILAGLANVPRAAALDVVRPLLSDPAVGPEAGLAMVRIAQGLLPSDRRRARQAAAMLAEKAPASAVRDQAARLLAKIDKMDDYVTAWQFSGPYAPQRRGSAFTTVFPPEKRSAKAVQWRPLKTFKANQPWIMDLRASMDYDNRACYVRTWVHSDKQQPARLEFGTDDGHKVWLNGKLVASARHAGAAVAGQFKAGVTLREGWNLLMLKVTQDTGPWEFCLRIRRPDGGRLEGLRIQARPPSE
ncbi:MAG: HEAT repeat domain-containing protein [Planctomycetes bacterium]|nr:HEAT repeat domain-containing protein [Planctomycetota bacterium]